MYNPFRRQLVKDGFTEDTFVAMAMGEILPGRVTQVTPDTALKSNAVLACLIVRAETFASLPSHVYESKGDSRNVVADHPVSLLTSGYANPLMTAAEFWRWKQLTEDVRGNAYTRVEWSGNKPKHLWPLTSSEMKVKYSSGAGVEYEYAGDVLTPKGTYAAKNILHFKGSILKNAWQGTSLVELAAEAIGLSIDAEKFYHRLLQNGSHFPGYLATDEGLKAEDIKALADQFNATKGVEDAGNVKIFDRGLKWQNNPMTIQQADLTAQQLWYLQQICRVFRVPPPLVQDWSRATYTNSEQADMWLAKHTILPIAINTEKVLGRIFQMTGEDRKGYHLKFEMEGLLRGDFKTRMEAYAAACGGPFMLRSEARRLEDMNPVEGLDKALVPLNTGVVGAEHERPAGRGEAAPAPIVAQAAERICIRAAQDRARGRSEQDTLEFATKVLAPIAEAYPTFDPAAFATGCLEETA